MNHYLVLLRNESIDFSKFSQEEMGQLLADFDAWNSRLISEGRLLLSASLQGGKGKTHRGVTVTDGPYSEAKEAIAGFMFITADSLEHASTLASGCPFLTRGGSVEVRFAPRVEFEDAALSQVQDQMSARKSAKEVK